MYLRHHAYTLYYHHVFAYCDARLNSRALRGGLKTLLNTIQLDELSDQLGSAKGGIVWQMWL